MSRSAGAHRERVKRRLLCLKPVRIQICSNLFRGVAYDVNRTGNF